MHSLPGIKRLLAAVTTAAVLGAVLLAVTAPRRNTEADDKAKAEAPNPWPLFGGSVQRNMVNLKEKGIASTWKIDRKNPNDPGKGKNILWVADLGSRAYGGPTIGDGKIFVGTNNEKPRNPKIVGDKGIIMCFDEKTGDFLWQMVHDKLPGGLVNDWPKEGICSSPVVEGKRIYYVSNRCELVCATTEGLRAGKNEGVQDEKYKDKTDGDVVWRLDMMKDLGVFPHNLATCSPLIVGDTVFLITSNGVNEDHINVPKPGAPSFLAVNKNDGKVKWSSNLPSVALELAQKDPKAKEGGKTLFKELVDAGKLIMHGQWSNPVYAEPNGQPQIIFPGGDGWIYAFTPDKGELIWKFDCNPKKSKYELGGRGTRSDFVSTPVVYQNKLYIGVGQDPEHDKGVGHFWCIDITKKPANKEKDLSPADDDKFDPKDPRNKGSGLVWHYGGTAPKGADRPYVFGRTMSTAAVHDGLVYIAELDRFLHCLDANTGKPYWEYEMDGNTWSSPYWVDGKVYLGNDAKQVLVFKHGNKLEEPEVIDMHSNVRATPVAANGVLYVMTENKLYAIKAK